MYYRYCIFASILAVGGIIIVPPAFAYTGIVNIIPGAGTSNHCSETSTCFNPSILHISVGDTVSWTNSDNVNHTVVSGLPYASQRGAIFDSDIIKPGNTYSFTFYDAGEYKYSDKVNRYMVGEIIVESNHGSPAVPEFGTLAGMIILVSIIGVVVISRSRFHV